MFVWSHGCSCSDSSRTHILTSNFFVSLAHKIFPPLPLPHSYLDMFCLSVCLSVSVRVSDSPGIEVTDSCGLPCGCWELNPSPLVLWKINKCTSPLSHLTSWTFNFRILMPPSHTLRHGIMDVHCFIKCCTVLSIEPRVLCTLDKHSTNWAASSAQKNVHSRSMLYLSLCSCPSYGMGYACGKIE